MDYGTPAAVLWLTLTGFCLFFCFFSKLGFAWFLCLVFFFFFFGFCLFLFNCHFFLIFNFLHWFLFFFCTSFVFFSCSFVFFSYVFFKYLFHAFFLFLYFILFYFIIYYFFFFFNLVEIYKSKFKQTTFSILPMAITGDSRQHLYLGKKKCGFGFLYRRWFDLVWKCLVFYLQNMTWHVIIGV